MRNRVTGSSGLALTRPPGSRAEEGGALRWRTLSVLCGVEFCVKQNRPPVMATKPVPDKRERQGSGESRKWLRRRCSERGGRIVRCRKSATSARQKSRNPDTGRGARTRSSSGAKILTSIPAGASKMLTSIRAETPAADVAREQPGKPDGIGFRHAFSARRGEFCASTACNLPRHRWRECAARSKIRPDARQLSGVHFSRPGPSLRPASFRPAKPSGTPNALVTPGGCPNIIIIIKAISGGVSEFGARCLRGV